MAFDHEEFGRRLRAIGDAPEVMTLQMETMAALAMIGVHAAYFIAPLPADPRGTAYFLNIGLPAWWERQYRARLHLLDPLPQLTVRRLKPLAWPQMVEWGGLDPGQRRYLRIAARQGLEQGIAMACFGPNSRCAFVGAVLPPGHAPAGPADLLRAHTAGQLSFLRYCHLIRHEDELPPLSNRELEVLHWIAQGKSNPVIAKILGISPSSVDIYVKRIFGKLNVSGRTSAAVKAVSLGLLMPADRVQPCRAAGPLPASPSTSTGGNADQ